MKLAHEPSGFLLSRKRRQVAAKDRSRKRCFMGATLHFGAVHVDRHYHPIYPIDLFIFTCNETAQFSGVLKNLRQSAN
jgi:hypothetical protein